MQPSGNAARSASRRPDIVRLLFDEQLSEDLVALLHDVFPDSMHVRLVNAGGAAGTAVWESAKTHGCLLVTKDEDFHRLSLLRGAPPKVAWLRVGNCTTAEVAELLRRHADDIRAFEAQAEATLLELG